MAAPALGAAAAADTAASVEDGEGVARARTRPAAAAADTATLVKDLIVRPSRADGAEGGSNGLRLRMAGSPRLAPGDEMAFTVESDRDGSLLLLDIDAAGNLVQIFPNDFTRAGRAGRIAAGDRLSLPGPGAGFRFRAAPPMGSGLLVAVLSDGSPRLSDIASRRKDLSVVPRPEAYVADLGEALRAAGDSDGGWSVATLSYEIVAP